MSPIPDRQFVRSLAASVIAAALFVPVDAMPWWVALLGDLPFGGWLWPLLAGAATLFVYRMGVRGGTDGVVSVDSPTGVDLDGTSRELEDSDSVVPVVPVVPVVQAALSLKDVTDVERDRRTTRYIGQSATISGAVANVRDDVESVLVQITLDGIDPAGKPVSCYCSLLFNPSEATAVKALDKGIVLKVKGTVKSVGRFGILLDKCELLRISVAANS